MPSKVISFPPGYFEENKQRPLSVLMVTTLLAACEKQNHGIPFGPGDIKGSFMRLIARGLIIRKDIANSKNTISPWQVTPEAISMLRSMGIVVAC